MHVVLVVNFEQASSCDVSKLDYVVWGIPFERCFLVDIDVCVYWKKKNNSQTSKMIVFAKINNNFWQTVNNIDNFAKSSILDVWQSFDYASETFDFFL